jgi:hypothetical protein
MQRVRTSKKWGAPYTAFGMASANTTATRSSRRLTTLGGQRRACYHGRRRPSLGRDNGANDRGRDARGTREGQEHWLPPPRRFASDLRVSFANSHSGTDEGKKPHGALASLRSMSRGRARCATPRAASTSLQPPLITETGCRAPLQLRPPSPSDHRRQSVPSPQPGGTLPVEAHRDP